MMIEGMIGGNIVTSYCPTEVTRGQHTISGAAVCLEGENKGPVSTTIESETSFT